jgi:hypothetical protein
VYKRQLEQMANYYDGVLYVDREIQAALPPLDQAAFDLHEAVYKVLRDQQGALAFHSFQGDQTLAETSAVARKLVAILFSDQVLEPVFAGPAPANSVHCESPYVELFATGSRTLEFTRIAVRLPSRLRAEMSAESPGQTLKPTELMGKERAPSPRSNEVPVSAERLVAPPYDDAPRRARGALQGPFSILGARAIWHVTETKIPFEYSVESTDGELDVPSHRMRCSAELPFFSPAANPQ